MSGGLNLNPEYESYHRGMQAAIARVRKVVREREFPYEVPVGELDDEALWIIAGAAVFGWHDSRLDSVVSDKELERLLPELGDMPINWGRPISAWSEGEMVVLLRGLSEVIIERFLRNWYIPVAHLMHLPWAMKKKLIAALEAEKAAPGEAAPPASEPESG
jgi:hypothetical protein